MGSKLFDVEKVRKDFPCLHQTVYGKPLTYLDSAATAQKPQVVVDAVREYYERYTSNVHRGAHYLSEAATKKYLDARKTVANFIGAKDPAQIVFTRSTTESINMIASCLGKVHFSLGDEIILSEMEHHANIVPWYLLAKEKGLVLRVAPVLDDGCIDIEAYRKLFSARTKLVAIVHASNSLGTINPVKEMTACAHDQGVPVLIDGAQAAHHFKVDVFDIGADFYCFSGHKAYGPTGIGVLYAKGDWLKRLPPYQGGGDMIASVSFSDITFAEPPQKFEAGTPNIAGALGMAAAIRYMESLGFDAIHQHEMALHDYALARLRDIPRVKVFGAASNKVSLLSFVIDGVHPHDVSSIFDREGVAIRAGHLCTQPVINRFNQSSFCRASLALYNTKEEIDRFINAFARVFEVFRI